MCRSSHPGVFLRKSVLKICSKFKGEHSCRSMISIKLLCNFIEIALRQGCSPANLLHIFRTPFLKNTCRRLLPGVLIFALKFNFKWDKVFKSGLSKFFKGCFPQNLFSPPLNNLSHILLCPTCSYVPHVLEALTFRYSQIKLKMFL